MSRGRSAQAPTHISKKGWMDILMRVKDAVGQEKVGLIAAGIAFYGLLALFPAITALLAVVGLVMDPDRVTESLTHLQGLVPQQALEIITTQATAVSGASQGGLGLAAVASLLFALYSASKGTASLMQGLNAAYDEEEERGIAMLTLTQLVLTLLIMLGITVGLAIIIVVPAVLTALSAAPWMETLATLAAYLLSFGLAILGVALLYRFGPSRANARFQWVSAGATIACTAWVLASAAFAFYVSNFGTYNETFGTLGGVVVLLMWFWISAFIVLLGAELNAETEAQTRRDTTTGPRAPMGERGAVKADQLGKRRPA